MGTVPTVKVQAGDGYQTINESDFDPEVHTLFEEPEASPDSGASTDGVGTSSTPKKKTRVKPAGK